MPNIKNGWVFRTAENVLYTLCTDLSLARHGVMMRAASFLNLLPKAALLPTVYERVLSDLRRRGEYRAIHKEGLPMGRTAGFSNTEILFDPRGIGNRMHKGSLTGDLKNYVDYCANKDGALTDVLVIRADLDDSIPALNAQHTDVTKLVLGGGLVILAHPDRNVTADPTIAANWRQYLVTHGLAHLGTIAVRDFVKNDNTIKLMERLIAERYSSAERAREFRRARFGKDANENARAFVFGRMFRLAERDLRRLICKHEDEDKRKARFEKALKKHATQLASAEAHDNQIKEKNAWQASERERLNAERAAIGTTIPLLPGEEVTLKGYRPWQKWTMSKIEAYVKPRTQELVEQLRANPPDAVKQMVERDMQDESDESMSSLEVASDTWQELMAEDRATQIRDEARVEELKLEDRMAKIFADERDRADMLRDAKELLKEIIKHREDCAAIRKRVNRVTLSHGAYDARLKRIHEWFGRKIKWGYLNLEIWANPRKEVGPDKKISFTHIGEWAVATAKTECLQGVSDIVRRIVRESSKVSGDHLDLCDDIAKWAKAERKGSLVEVIDFGSIVPAPISLLAAPKVEISMKLSARFRGTAEAYMAFDGCQFVYNPAMQRESGLRKGLLDRPTIVAQGHEFIQQRLGIYGYKLVINDQIQNLIARRKEHSDKNRSPNREVLGFEAPAYYDYGYRKAEHTLYTPAGKPVWITNKDYLVTPGWDRRSRTISEDEILTETPEGLRPSTETVRIDYGITYWRVESEIGTLTIYEDESREEAEFRISLAIDPSQVRRNGDDDGAIASIIEAVEETQAPQEAVAVPTNLQTTWNQWRPYIDEFIEVFPAPTPAAVEMVYSDPINNYMRRALHRFGPVYSAPTEKAAQLVPSEKLIEKAMQSFARDLANNRVPRFAKK